MLIRTHLHHDWGIVEGRCLSHSPHIRGSTLDTEARKCIGHGPCRACRPSAPTGLPWCCRQLCGHITRRGQLFRYTV
jgi:hypothetical protein